MNSAAIPFAAGIRVVTAAASTVGSRRWSRGRSRSDGSDTTNHEFAGTFRPNRFLPQSPRCRNWPRYLVAHVLRVAIEAERDRSDDSTGLAGIGDPKPLQGVSGRACTAAERSERQGQDEQGKSTACSVHSGSGECGGRRRLLTSTHPFPGRPRSEPGRIRWDRRRSRRDPPAGENDRRPCTLEQRGVLRRFAVAAADRRALAGNHHQGLVADFPPRAAAPSEIDSHFMGESGAAGCPSSSRISSCASSPPPATRSSAPGASRGSRRAWPRQSTRGTRVCSPVGRHPRWPSPYCRPSAPG